MKKKVNQMNKRILMVSFVVLLMDIISKVLVVNLMYEGESIIFIKNFLSLTYVKNNGIAFSLFEGRISLIVIFTFLIIFWLVKELWGKDIPFVNSIFYGMILGGAIGNLVDRLFYGYVIDFIDIDFFGYDYPIFNVADCFIVIGVILSLVISLKEESSGKNGTSSR